MTRGCFKACIMKSRDRYLDEIIYLHNVTATATFRLAAFVEVNES